MNYLQKTFVAAALLALTAPSLWAANAEKKTAYLFSYFTGNSQQEEQIRFAVSRDGLNYYALNKNEPIVSSDTIAVKAAVRDPHILRGEDGCFYMVATDMKSAEGWSSNRGLVLMKSKDLVNWSHSAINFPTTWGNKFGDVTRIWAPQTIYDPQAGKYMVYFSILTSKPGDYDKEYYCYANKDFTELSEPKVLFDRGKSTIDADIIYFNGEYNMFFKTEGNGNGIMIAKSKSLTANNWTCNNVYVDQNDNSVEGAGVYEMTDGKTWVLMYDVYSRGYYEFCETTDMVNFKKMTKPYSFDFHPRHGTVMTITEKELQRLCKKWGTPKKMTIKTARNKAAKKK